VQYTWMPWDEAANYLLNSKGNLQDALKDSDNSLQYEERFENLLTKSQVLDALDKKDEATATRNKAIESANALQLHGYGRLLQTQGKQQEAMEIFRTNLKKHPDHWIAHNEAARLACAQGDFDGAVREMKLSSAGAPDNFKPQLESLVKRLEAKEDINR
jgi:tetratricopeptide (TPR) repeat protein